jgi:hypothetical protein
MSLRKSGAIAVLIAVIGVSVAGNAPPASATIHEGPVGSWCSIIPSGSFTQLIPPGLTPGDGKGPDSNVARPLISSGMLQIEVIDGIVWVSINEDHPAVHTVGTGEFQFEPPNFMVEEFELDPEFPAFANCNYSPLGAP